MTNRQFNMTIDKTKADSLISFLKKQGFIKIKLVLTDYTNVVLYKEDNTSIRIPAVDPNVWIDLYNYALLKNEKVVKL